MFMELVEFAEKMLGRELTVREKKILRFYQNLPKDSVLIMGRAGYPIWYDRDGNMLKPEDFAK